VVSTEIVSTEIEDLPGFKPEGLKKTPAEVD
jgi:hypothetical protein